MSSSHEPLVSIVTPAYNGGQYLAECLESILAQRYQNWDCTIVNNRSSDDTLATATEYARKYSPRIRVHNNAEFLEIIPNHNHAIRQISPGSKYCKVVFADDWLYPECLETMVDIAERYPAAGIVGSYALAGSKVLFDGLPHGKPCIPGREICRATLLGGPYVFGTPTTLLIRSSLVRQRPQFYNEANLHADFESCFDVLETSDFGFAYQVLSYSRPRAASNDGFARRMETHVLGNLATFLKYGQIYLEPDEYQAGLRRWMDHYYGVLAKNALRFRGREFWDYHRNRMRELNCRLSYPRLAWAMTKKALGSAVHPLDALDSASKWWPRTIDGSARNKSAALEPGAGRAL